MYDTGVALTGLSCFVTPDLARDLANDIMTLVSHRECFAVLERTVLSLTISFILATLWCFPALKYELLSSLQMSHTKPYIRKKAVLIMYKVFLKYPESLRPAFPRLKEKLEDPDPGIWINTPVLMGAGILCHCNLHLRMWNKGWICDATVAHLHLNLISSHYCTFLIC